MGLGWLKNLFTGGAGQLLKTVDQVIDNVTTTTEEKMNLELAKERLRFEILKTTSLMEQKAAELVQKDLAGVREQAMAELKSEDSYVRRARPSIIWVGIAVFVVNYIILPAVSFISGKVFAPVQLPDAFWYTWGSITGGYAFLRTLEKTGTKLKLFGNGERK